MTDDREQKTENSDFCLLMSDFCKKGGEENGRD